MIYWFKCVRICFRQTMIQRAVTSGTGSRRLPKGGRINMRSYKKIYLYLFNAISEAVAELEQGNSAAAENLLKEAQAESEELLIKVLEK